MRIYWYWPTPHLRMHPWPLATARTGDSVTVHSLIPPEGESPERVSGYRLRRDLPRPCALERSDHLRWWVSRSRTYWQRARLREQLVYAEHYDICHIHHVNLLTDWWAIPRLRRRAPVVLTVHDVVPHVRRLPEGVEDRLLQGAYRAADALIVHHEALRSELRTRFGIDPSKVMVLPHPVRTVARLRAEDVDDRTVLFFGSFRRNKGIPVLLQAIDKLRGHDDVRFVFAGAGDRTLQEGVRNAARLDGRIVPEISKVSDDRRDHLFRSAGLVVLPYSDFHSQSGVLADAYSYGRPVVVTDVGALGDTVREDGTGWVARPNDPRDLARALDAALRDRPGRISFAKAARRAGRERSYPVVGRQLRSIYDVATEAARCRTASQVEYGPIFQPLSVCCRER